MNDAKYIGLDVHQATISAVVLDSAGKLLMESTFETKASTILQFLDGLRGSVQVTFEEGTCAAWLYDLVKPHVHKVVVCDPRKNALLKAGNKSDRIDARKLADLLRTGLVSAVYHGDHSVRTLKELARSYLALTQDATRVMNRLKALYRGVGRFPAPEGGLTRSITAENGSLSSPKPAHYGAQNFVMSNSTLSRRCVSMCDGICWRKAGSTAR